MQSAHVGDCVNQIMRQIEQKGLVKEVRIPFISENAATEWKELLDQEYLMAKLREPVQKIEAQNAWTLDTLTKTML
jgi:hypothetical protein